MNCSNCGGSLRYDVERYGLVCDHCGTFKPLKRPEERASVGEMDFAAALQVAGRDWGVSRRLVSCKSCGAQMLYGADQMSGLCPFCGTAIVLSAEEADCGIAPTAIIPFSITKEEVTEKFYRWNKFAFWSPEKFRRGKVLGNLTPIYIPYWSFDADTVTTYGGRFGYTRGSGDSETTTWNMKSGIVEKHIKDFCICGSGKFINDKMFNSVITFRPGELMPYDPEILAGMPAEIYTIGLDRAWLAAKNGEGMKKKIMDAARDNENADCTSDLKCSTEFSNIKYKYVLVPVWLSGCKYGGKIYSVVASGSNGRGNCTRPVSIAKLVSIIVILLACAILRNFIPFMNVITMIGMYAVIAAVIIYIIMFFVTLSSQKEEERKKAQDRGF